MSALRPPAHPPQACIACCSGDFNLFLQVSFVVDLEADLNQLMNQPPPSASSAAAPAAAPVQRMVRGAGRQQSRQVCINRA